jgi:hypothetical protein
MLQSIRVNSRFRRAQQTGQALILSLLVVIVIISICGGILYPKLAGRNEYDGNGNVQGAATPIDQAYDASCTIYMQQVSAAAVQYRQDHNAPPPDLESLKPYGVTEDIINTPNCNFGLPKQRSYGSAAPAATPGVAVIPTPSAAAQQAAQQAPDQRRQQAPDNTGNYAVGGGVNVHIPTAGTYGQGQ